jgi:NADP-dependent 3-hydroxy acid dehydrogenase YdfG
MSESAAPWAFVTGAGSGIGSALALTAAKRGMHVVACDYRPESLQRVADEALQAGAASVVTRAFDVRDAAVFESVVSELGASGARVDWLFCNAGVLSAGRLWETSAAEIDRLLDINIKGVINGIRACVPKMIERGQPAHIVITGSMGGFIPSPMLAAYSASKAAIAAIAETLLFDLRASQAPVSVSLLAPGAVRTGIFAHEFAHGTGDAANHALMAAMRAGAERVGMDPMRLAEMTFEAVESGRFWVFPHPEMLPAVTERIARMRAGEMPSFEFERSFRQPASR